MSAFARAVREADPSALRAERIDTLMVNVGLRCDQACPHCHQSCSPLRSETMPREIMEAVAGVADRVGPSLIDITGGAPELNPDIRHLVCLLRDGGHPVRMRTNLTALLSPEASGLIDFLADHGVDLLASLPGATESEFAPARGPVFDRCLTALRLLSEAGYGRPPGPRLEIAVNPAGAALPEPKQAIEARFRAELTDRHGIDFNDIIVITNVPAGRLQERLEDDGVLADYLRVLREAFNPQTLPHLSCRTCIDIAWDGTLSDCDFNLGRGMRLADGLPSHISEFELHVLASRPVRFSEHCFACAAMAGSG